MDEEVFDELDQKDEEDRSIAELAREFTMDELLAKMKEVMTHVGTSTDELDDANNNLKIAQEERESAYLTNHQYLRVFRRIGAAIGQKAGA